MPAPRPSKRARMRALGQAGNSRTFSGERQNREDSLWLSGVRIPCCRNVSLSLSDHPCLFRRSLRPPGHIYYFSALPAPLYSDFPSRETRPGRLPFSWLWMKQKSDPHRRYSPPPRCIRSLSPHHSRSSRPIVRLSSGLHPDCCPPG